MDDYARSLYISNPLRKPLLQKAIDALYLPAGSSGLDAGCGIGLQISQLAEAVGPAGHVTGLDASESFLAYAREHAAFSGLADRVSFQYGEWGNLPFEDAAFDWVWSADAAGYAAREPLEEVRELARVVKPGGIVAVLFWSSQNLLPGYPLLEARLNATRAGIAPFALELPPERHYLRMLRWMCQAGLANARMETFVHSVSAPLANDFREALTALFEMRWGGAQDEVSPEDWAAFQRLCQPSSSDFLLNCPDYCAFYTVTMFRGEVQPG